MYKDDESPFEAEETLARLRAMPEETIEAIVDAPRKGVYISFVGWFAAADWNFLPVWDTLVGWENYPENVDYWVAIRDTMRKWIYKKALGWEIREETRKDSLTVTIYDDPGESGWGFVIADCPDGNWIEIARVNLNSFEHGAAVPPGCEVHILD